MTSRVWSRGRTPTLVLLIALGGCASPIPKAIRTAPVTAVTVAQVQQEPARYPDQRVRWGGTIIAVNNLADVTEIEVLSRPLDSDGEPHSGEPGTGRFIARVTGFLDPAEYQKERALTVVGTLAGVQTRPVGDYRYAYPLLRVESRYLWPKAAPPVTYAPYGYPGWYGPWGPWGPYGLGYDPWFAPYGPYRGRGHWRH
ncbi:Slp family lipoprotein [uncultured Thiodictyon sp.]|uniref:Slp family lipoprotein n=1 Tax=uncultured Thiodictyon sp. TaxID=1846217 RepID=UPI0025FDF842|nr:Slp family lipoprotein [uncultured Thiodictyon sp.]